MMTVQINDDRTPYSPLYDDIYYSRENGLDESRYVFLKGNRLPDRWRHKSCHVVAETGFGTGLNFLVTWQMWARTFTSSRQLHYISIDRHPLDKAQLEQVHHTFPELQCLSKKLISAYPDALSGFHRIRFPDQGVSLTLCFMDVQQALAELTQPADCWFLDGFAPDKNPQMWNQRTIRLIAGLSHSETSLATFTASGTVQRNLRQAGFEVQKIPGFGSKREMITARIKQPPGRKTTTPWFSYTLPRPAAKQAVIIGAGIAGCQIAWHLALRGWRIDLIERNPMPSQEASGNPLAVLAPKMHAAPNSAEDFFSSCFQYARNQLEMLDPDQQCWSPCGVMNLAISERAQHQWHRLRQRGFSDEMLQCLDHKEASRQAGIPVTHKAVFFPTAGWVSPNGLCQRLLDHHSIRIITETEAVHIHYEKDRWCIGDSQHQPIVQAPVLVIASGKDRHFDFLDPLPSLPISGQTSYARATALSRDLKVILNHEGYILPAVGDKHLFGATYRLQNTETEPHAWADRENLDRQSRHLPGLTQHLGPIDSAHAAVRITAPDRYPYLGALPNPARYQVQYADIRHGKHWQRYPPPDYYPGLFVSLGYASRGLTTSPLCAELLAGIIHNEPPALPQTLVNALHPARYLIRTLKRPEPNQPVATR